MNDIVAAGSSQNVPVVSDNLDVTRSGRWLERRLGVS
jgi:hypothetical protein